METCVICGQPTTWSGRGRRPLTCGSPECRKAHRAVTVREYRWRQRGGSTSQVRACINCGSEFEFVRVEGMRGAGPSTCSPECRDQRQRQVDREKQVTFRRQLPVEERVRRRRVALLARHGLTPESYAALVASQGGVCAICRRPETKHHSLLLKIDHDHTCCPGDKSCGRCIRGLLCSNCNRGIGLFNDDPSVLRSAADYLGGSP